MSSDTRDTADPGVTTSVPTTDGSSTRAEVPHTLAEPAPRPLGLRDQLGLWANLGVSLLGFTGALVVLQPGGPGTPHTSLLSALLATAVGTVLGAAAIAISAVPGARTGAPAMVLLRGLFGGRASYVPTVLNVVQMIGWGTFELVTIAAAVNMIVPSIPTWPVVLVGGVITTALAMYPLGAVRILRRYVTVLVLLSLAYLAVQLLRSPLPPVTAGTWDGFAVGVDTTVAVAVSWVPMAADYSRHSRSPRSAAVGAFTGYAIAQFACYAIGLLALVSLPDGSDAVFAVFLAVPVGWLAFSILTVRELDQSFANVYSTTVSVQNVRPRWDRRWISLTIGVLTVVLALLTDIYGYAAFLSLIGSLFVPMFAVLVVDYFGFSGRNWDVRPDAPVRWAMLVPWALGFVAYHVIYPGDVGGWSDFWTGVGQSVGFTAPPWMSASLTSFVVAAVVTALFGLARRARRT